MTDALQRRTSPFDGTGFENISDELEELGREMNTAFTDLEAIEQGRREAIAVAEAPFRLPIQEAEAKVTELEKASGPNTVVEKIQQSGLDQLSLTALDIILRRNGVPVNEFAAGIQELSFNELSPINKLNPSHRATSTQRYLKTFGGFRAFSRDIDDTAVSGDITGIAVGLFTIEWQEDWEGRDSRTGAYKKRLDITIGTATPDNIRVVDQDISPDGSLQPVLQPRSIVLDLPKAILIRGYSDWGEEKTDLTQEVDQEIELIAVPTEDDRMFHRVRSIDWIQSIEGKFPIVEAQARSHQVASNKAYFIAWHNNVFSVLSKLAVDQNVDGTTRSNLREVVRRVSVF